MIRHALKNNTLFSLVVIAVVLFITTVATVSCAGDLSRTKAETMIEQEIIKQTKGELVIKMIHVRGWGTSGFYEINKSRANGANELVQEGYISQLKPYVGGQAYLIY